MTGCSHCRDLDAVVEIRSPDGLQNVLRVVRENLQDGTLRESLFWPEGKIRLSEGSFDTVSLNPPWPDVMAYYFECSECRQRYVLAVETYKGVGGTWAPDFDAR